MVVVVGGWINPLQTLSQGLVLTLRFTFDTELDNVLFRLYLYLHDFAGDVHGVMLPPALIEHHPHDDAWVVLQLINPAQGFISMRVDHK